VKPALRMAARTRSLASWTAASGSPTIVRGGQAAGDVHLYVYQVAFQPHHGSGLYLGEHTLRPMLL
jgi:hypothetical protein